MKKLVLLENYLALRLYDAVHDTSCTTSELQEIFEIFCEEKDLYLFQIAYLKSTLSEYKEIFKDLKKELKKG